MLRPVAEWSLETKDAHLTKMVWIPTVGRLGMEPKDPRLLSSSARLRRKVSWIQCPALCDTHRVGFDNLDLCP